VSVRLLKPLVLASQSPRRLQLLRQIGFSPVVAPCDVPEEFTGASPEENAVALALRKAKCVAGGFENAFVIGADTIVVVDGLLLGKPTGVEDAHRMLELLSGKTHIVHTAFAIVDRPSGESVTAVESTRVTFRVLPRREIEEYVDGGSPLDKAGAYGIQDDYGAVFVSRVEGCYYTVVGLPLSRLYVTLDEFQRRIEKVHG
jgi:septum formation protein